MRQLFRDVLGGQGENPWDTRSTAPILLKTRARRGSGVKEIWAEGDLAAQPVDIQSAVCDVARFAEFMPYMTEARVVGSPDPDGAHYNYSRLDLPVLSPRDFIHKVYVDRDASTDPQGVFANHWTAAPTKLPELPSVVRLKISEGSWLVTPSADGKSSHVVYLLCVDPAGAIPTFATNRANSRGITDTFDNIEREAQRRGRARLAGRS